VTDSKHAPGRPPLRVVCGGEQPAKTSAAPPPQVRTKYAGNPRAAAEVAFRCHIEPHFGFLERYVASLGFKGQDQEDMVQEVLLAAFRGMDQFDENRAHVRSWLAGIAERQATNFLRRAHRHHDERLPEELLERLKDAGPLPDECAIEAGRRRVLQELVRGVPKKQYEVLVLRDFVGLTFEEIGEELAIPVPTARKRYRLAWRRLHGARIRWQAVQRRKGYAIIPMAAASIMASKPAWSAVGRGAQHVIVRLLGLVAVLAVAVGLGSDAIREPTVAAAPARPGLARLARAEATKAGTVGAPATGTRVTPPADKKEGAAVRVSASRSEHVAGRSRSRSATGAPRPERVGEEAMMQLARAALAVGNYAEARRLLEQHERDFPQSHGAGERAAYLQKLRVSYEK